MLNKCCKYAKFLPHNWICLKGLYFLFLGVFYLVCCYGVYQAVMILIYPQASWAQKGMMAAQYLLNDAIVAIAFLTLAKVLHALYAIKKAVAPCCCTAEAKEAK